jgi:hypothetical protein
MKYTLSVLNERVEFWVNELGERIVVGKADEKYTTIEITIDSSTDLLHIFHAGIRAGMAVFHK